jgi:hypothetical protein
LTIAPAKKKADEEKAAKDRQQHAEQATREAQSEAQAAAARAEQARREAEAAQPSYAPTGRDAEGYLQGPNCSNDPNNSVHLCQ